MHALINEILKLDRLVIPKDKCDRELVTLQFEAIGRLGEFWVLLLEQAGRLATYVGIRRGRGGRSPNPSTFDGR